MEEWTLLRQRLGWAGFIKLAMGETKTNPPAQSHQHEKRSRGGVVRAPQRAAAIYPPLSLSLSLLDAGLPSSELGTQTNSTFFSLFTFPFPLPPLLLLRAAVWEGFLFASVRGGEAAAAAALALLPLGLPLGAVARGTRAVRRVGCWEGEGGVGSGWLAR